MSSKKGSTRKRKNAVSPPSPQSFQFINFTDAPHLDEDDRDIIRSKAISDYHQRKRNNNPRTSVESTHSLKPSISKFRVLPPSHVPDNRIASVTVQHVRRRHEISANNHSSQISSASNSTNSRVSISHNLNLEHGTLLLPAAIDLSLGRDEIHYDKAVLPYFPPHSKRREDFVQKIDLLALNLDPLLNLPINSSPKMRLWIHHYCESFSTQW